MGSFNLFLFFRLKKSGFPGRIFRAILHRDGKHGKVESSRNRIDFRAFLCYDFHKQWEAGGENMTNEELLEILNKRFDLLDHQIGGLDKRIDSLDNRVGKIESRLDNVDGRLDNIDGRLDNVDGRLDNIDGRLNNIEGRLENLEEEAEITRSGVNDLLAWATDVGRSINIRLAE